MRHGAKVDALSRNEKGYRLSAGEASFHARNVIVATGAFHTPYIPSIAQELDRDIFQLHSVDYRNPRQVPVQNVAGGGGG